MTVARLFLSWYNRYLTACGFFSEALKFSTAENCAVERKRGPPSARGQVSGPGGAAARGPAAAVAAAGARRPAMPHVARTGHLSRCSVRILSDRKSIVIRNYLYVIM